MERGPEVDHESILRSGSYWSSDWTLPSLIREFERLDCHWVLDELVHETDPMIPRRKHIRINFLSDNGVIKTIGLNWERLER